MMSWEGGQDDVIGASTRHIWTLLSDMKISLLNNYSNLNFTLDSAVSTTNKSPSNLLSSQVSLRTFRCQEKNQMSSTDSKGPIWTVYVLRNGLMTMMLTFYPLRNRFHGYQCYCSHLTTKNFTWIPSLTAMQPNHHDQKYSLYIAKCERGTIQLFCALPRVSRCLFLDCILYCTRHTEICSFQYVPIRDIFLL